MRRAEPIADRSQVFFGVVVMFAGIALFAAVASKLPPAPGAWTSYAGLFCLVVISLGMTFGGAGIALWPWRHEL